MEKRMRVALITLALMSIMYAPAGAQKSFDVEKERADLWRFFADKHADIGDEYRKYQLFEDARAHYMRALEFDADNRGARSGLGQKKKGGEWVDDEPLPAESPLEGEAKAAARKKPDEARDKTYEKCAVRARKQVKDAESAGDADAARIMAIEVLRYAPNDEHARKLRGHINAGDDWMPEKCAEWRQAGLAAVAKATDGKEFPGTDEQAKAIGATFYRRQSDHLVTRSSKDIARAMTMHKHAEAHLTRAMEILGVSGAPFGTRRYTITHLDTNRRYYDMLEKVLKLEGDELEFGKKLSGHGQTDPWGFIARSNTDMQADDMIGNTLSIMLLESRRGGAGSADWLKTGFSYLVTSQVIARCGTTRSDMRKVGQTGSNFEVLPEFTKKSGSPEQLRDVILNEVIRGRDLPLEKLTQVGVNDMTIEYAAKGFSLMEYCFAKYPDATREWLKAAAPKADGRIAIIEKHLGKKVDELEKDWRAWVLMNY
jgi:hypothetical protein